MGDMDPATREKHARILFGKLMAFRAMGLLMTIYVVYAIFGSGYECANEAQIVIEDPGYGWSMAQVNPKWKFAMENYYRKMGQKIPWEDNTKQF